MGQQILGRLLACIADRNLGLDRELREVLVGDGLHLIVSDMHQRTHPELHLAEDTAQTPHILTLQVRAIAPAIDLDSELVAAFANVFRHVELRRRHRVLAVAHLLTVHPDIEGGMDATKVQNQILREHLLRDIDEGHIASHGVAMVVGIPVLRRLSRHAGTVAMERILHVDVDRLAEALQLPVARHLDVIPSAHVKVLTIEIGRT